MELTNSAAAGKRILECARDEVRDHLQVFDTSVSVDQGLREDTNRQDDEGFVFELLPVWSLEVIQSPALLQLALNQVFFVRIT